MQKWAKFGYNVGMNSTDNDKRPRVGRLAPSPTGALHLGNIRTFMMAWLQMRACGGRVLLRIEDLDHPKHKPGADVALMEDLQWLGFDWDAPPQWQQARVALYEAALAQLNDALYPCFCSRADIQRAQSAPHPGEVLRYPGICRNRTHTAVTEEQRSRAALRLALTDADDGAFVDGFAGDYAHTAAALTGDFVVARAGQAAYTLAVVVDDAAMGVTDVVRGDDILPATPAQIVLYRRLGLAVPNFFHVPLVTGKDGNRLAKRHGDTRIASYRAAGVSAGRILSALARSCGWLKHDETVSTLADLIPRFTLETVPKTPFIWDDALL
jgi:glutamyl-tRNA synthetase